MALDRDQVRGEAGVFTGGHPLFRRGGDPASHLTGRRAIRGTTAHREAAGAGERDYLSRLSVLR